MSPDRHDFQQRDCFLGGEGDRWFARNDGDQIVAHTRHALDALAEFVAPNDIVLEIGCADGRNLDYLAHRRPGVHGVGIEPSAAAVGAARRRHSSVEVMQGTADHLPLESESCNVVVFGFCLYLVDRRLLFQTLAEADRVLRDRGFLAIVDFDPVGPRIRPYRHRAGLFSYKMDYSQPFLATGHYHMAARTSYAHAGGAFSADPGERVALSVLYKDVMAGYVAEGD